MDGRCAKCGTWLMPGHGTCAGCDAPVPGMEVADDHDPLDPFSSHGDGLPTLEDLSPAAPVAALAPAPVVDLPSPTAAPRPAPRDTQARLRQAAGYDLPPESLLASVPYAASVWFRRRDLRSRVRDVAAREHVLARALDKQRQALAEALATEPAAEGVMGLSGLLAPARAALQGVAQDVAERQAQIASEVAARQVAQGAVDEAARDVAPLRDQETRSSRALEAAKGELARAQAALRRVEIELRNAAQTGADGESMASQEATRESRQAEVTLLAGRVKERTAELGLARRELAARLGRQAAAEEDARLLSPSITLRTQASTQLPPAVLVLTDAALRADLGVVAAGPASLCADAHAAWRSAQSEAELLTEAELSFDVPAFRKGAAILGVGVAIVCIALLVAIFR